MKLPFSIPKLPPWRFRYYFPVFCGLLLFFWWLKHFGSQIAASDPVFRAAGFVFLLVLAGELLLGFLAAIQGVSESERAADEIRDLAKFPSENPNPVLRVALNGNLLYANKAGLKMLPQWHLRAGQAVPPFLMESAKLAWRTGTTQTHEFQHGDCQFEFALTPVLDGGYVNAYGRNITARKAAEGRLRESEEKLKGVFDGIVDGILIADSETKKFVMANKAICDMLGYSREELLGLGAQDIHPATDWPLIQANMEKQASGEIDLTPDVRCRRKDGSVFTADITGVPIVHQGRPCLMDSFRDVTEIKAARASLAQADRLASMGMLAAGVAHEINNPLTFVMFNIQRLAREIPLISMAKAATTEGAVKKANDAFSGLERIRDIVRGLGSFSRVEQSPPHPVAMRDSIEHAITMARNQIKYRARLAVDIEEGLPPVMANEGNLAQVFLNLLVNAAQAIGEGAAEANMIKVRAFAGGGRVYAEVSDTGKGIPKEIQSRIFEPFYTTKAVGMGSGLGLSICHGIITSLGGEISFTSEDGKGSIFRLWLPSALVRLEALPGKGPAAPAVEGPARSGRILVIDDESGIRDVFKGLFGADHEVVEAASGERAQEILKEDTGFDAILCDLMMPGMSGLDLHRWLAQDCPGLARRVIFITGGAFAAGAQEYLAALENPRFEKPFDIAKVVGAVNQLINSAVKKD